MLQGLPEWDNRIEVARKLCKKYEAKLIEISPEETSTLLGASGIRLDWIDKFEELFPDEDLEFVGTLAIKKVLLRYAEKFRAQAIITGLNAEDICAEILACLTLGYSPKPYPTRSINNINFWYPLYLTPKKIADGCFPTHARDNYADRYPSHAYGRSLFYYLAQCLEDRCPGFLVDFISGVEKTFYERSSEKGKSQIPEKTLRKWKKIFPFYIENTSDNE